MKNLKTVNEVKDMNYYLELDGYIAFNIAIFDRFSSIGDSCYSEICGGKIEGVHQWATHNISNIEECANDKYTGWTIHFNDGYNESTGKVYIPNWVMNTIPKDWKHAKNLFNKYLIKASTK